MSIHRAIVNSATTLTPNLACITLGGEGVADFLSTGIDDEYVRVFFPHDEDPTHV